MTRCTPVITHNKHLSTPPTMAGLFFCLASAEGVGLLFCHAAIRPIQAFTARFAPSMQLYHTRRKTVHRALQGLFLRLTRSTAHDTRQTQAAIIPPAPRWRAYHQAQHLRRYQIPAPRRTLYRPAQPPYYNKVYNCAGVRHCYRSMPDSAAYRKPCQPGGATTAVCGSLASADTLSAVHTRRTC